MELVHAFLVLPAFSWGLLPSPSHINSLGIGHVLLSTAPVCGPWPWLPVGCLPSLLVGGWDPSLFSQEFLDLTVLWIGAVKLG